MTGNYRSFLSLWLQTLPHATVPGYRRSCRPRSPASRNGTTCRTLAKRAGCRRQKIYTNAHGSCVRAGRAGWTPEDASGASSRVTCDGLSGTCPGRLGGAAGRAHVGRRGGSAGCLGRESNLRPGVHVLPSGYVPCSGTIPGLSYPQWPPDELMPPGRRGSPGGERRHSTMTMAGSPLPAPSKSVSS